MKENESALTPLNRWMARDLDDAEHDQLKAEIQGTHNSERLKQLGDQIIELTGYGSSHVLNTAALARAFALSGLKHAAELASLIDLRSQKIAYQSEPREGNYHGYREALTQTYLDSSEQSEHF